MAANIIGKDDFLEIFVSTPLEECEKRDVKGLYAKARKGKFGILPEFLHRLRFPNIRHCHWILPN